METKQSRNYMENIRARMRMTHSFYVDPIGLSGGLAIWWRNDVSVSVLRASKNHIDMKLDIDGGVFITGVYGAPDSRDSGVNRRNRGQTTLTTASLEPSLDHLWHRGRISTRTRRLYNSREPVVSRNGSTTEGEYFC
ncbi:hypothetical protein LINPERHAP2_LOCUS4642 [Linum perenne]